MLYCWSIVEPPGRNVEYSTQKEKLELRSYQQDLAHPAIQGKNCIIVAPTGSGKTFVAMKIIDVSILLTYCKTLTIRMTLFSPGIYSR